MEKDIRFLNFPDRYTIPDLHRFCDSLIYANKRRHKEDYIADLMKTHNPNAQKIIDELKILYSEMLKTQKVDVLKKNEYIRLTRNLYKEILDNPIGKKQAKDINNLLKSMSLQVEYNFYSDLVSTSDIDTEIAGLFDQFAQLSNSGHTLLADKILVALEKKKVSVIEGSYYVLVMYNKRCIMAMF